MVGDVWPAVSDLLGVIMGAVALGLASWNVGIRQGYRQGMMDAVNIQGKVPDGSAR